MWKAVKAIRQCIDSEPIANAYCKTLYGKYPGFMGGLNGQGNVKFSG